MTNALVLPCLLTCPLLLLGQVLGCADQTQHQAGQHAVVHYGEQPTEQTNPIVTYTGEARNGLVWTVKLRETYTNHDSIVLLAELITVAEHGPICDTRDMPGRPYLLFAAEGQEPQAVPIQPLHSPWSESGLRRSTPGPFGYRLHTDLRIQLGDLELGTYTLQVVIPADAYAVTNQDDIEPVELVSPPVSFTLQSVALSAAQDTLPDDAAVALEVGTIEAIHYSGSVSVMTAVGTLTNRGNKPITFPAYIGGHENGDPYLCIGGYARWTGALGWSNESLEVGYCGTGLGTVTLMPGDSTRLMLCHLPEDGIYRFEVEYWIGDDQDARATAVSNAVVMDHWAEAYREETEVLRARGHLE